MPRQNGKNEVILIRELHGIATGEHIIHTAHRADTAHKAWERLLDRVEAAGLQVASTYRARGKEHIEIDGGGKIEFRTRTSAGGLGEISDLRPEVRHGDSRYDFSFVKDGRQCFLEVKGCTLEHDGVCAFPDAPTERGAKHIRGLTKAAGEGYGAYILFVIQMSDVKYIRPHDETDPEFGKALREAAQNGVTVLAMDCAVTEDTMELRLPVLVNL